MANRIGGAGIAGKEERLAAAAAEVQLAALTAPARLGHPVSAAEALEYRRGKPDIRQRGLSNVGKLQARNLPRRLTGQDGAIGRDRQEHPAPAVQAGLGKLLKVIGQDVKDFQP